MYRDVSVTNGIGFSPDGTTVYHSDTARNHVICHDVDPETGTVDLDSRRPLGQRPGFLPDGLAVDAEGVIWIADYGAGAVVGLSPEGEEVGRIEVPSQAVTSLCFGGADLRDCYIVTADNTDDPSRAGTIFRTRVDVPGLATPQATV